MDFDFNNWVLVPATLILFVVCMLDLLLWKQHKRAKRGEIAQENALIGLSYDILPILAVVVIVRAFLIEPFNIPSDSMVPTLQTGDYILVNKFSFGVRLPILNTKILDSGEPHRGDVAVFRYPVNPSVSFIKRVIGLPGDKIVYDDGQLSINGEKISKLAIPGVGDSAYERFYHEQMGTHNHVIRELDGVWSASSATFILDPKNGQVASADGHHWAVTVPAGHYFMMGDNRDQSADSRFWGFVPEENLSGRAFYIWAHKDPGLHLPTFSRDGAID